MPELPTPFPIPQEEVHACHERHPDGDLLRRGEAGQLRRYVGAIERKAAGCGEGHVRQASQQNQSKHMARDAIGLILRPAVVPSAGDDQGYDTGHIPDKRSQSSKALPVHRRKKTRPAAAPAIAATNPAPAASGYKQTQKGHTNPTDTRLPKKCPPLPACPV
jgi:hypothetical protein